MRDFNSAKEIFKDVIDTSFYFDSLSAEFAKKMIRDFIFQKNVPLMFMIGDPGVGKSYLLRLIEKEIKHKYLTVFLDNPFFDKKDFLELLYKAKGLNFDKDKNFNDLKNEIIREYKDIKHVIFIDEAQLLSEEQFELLRILSDTKVFKFVFTMHKEEGKEILKRKHIKSRDKSVIEINGLHKNEVLRYIQSSLISNSFMEIAQMFSKNHALKIARYSSGNFRVIKRFLYKLMVLLDFAKKNSLKRYEQINSTLLLMVAIDLGLTNE